MFGLGFSLASSTINEPGVFARLRETLPLVWRSLHALGAFDFRLLTNGSAD